MRLFHRFFSLHPYSDFTSIESLTRGLASLRKEGTLEKGMNRVKNREQNPCISPSLLAQMTSLKTLSHRGLPFAF